MNERKYFAFIDGEQRGPFSVRELADEGVRPSTYVWCKGMDDWKRADSVDEILDYFRTARHTSTRIDNPDTVYVSPATESSSQGAPGQTPGPEEQKPERIGFPFRETNATEPDINTPPQVSMAFAVLALLFCFFPTGIAAVFFTYKAQKCWQSSLQENNPDTVTSLRRQAHEYGRLAKMWLGMSVAFGIIVWTFFFSF